MNAIIERINSFGYAFVEFALPMLIQSGVLILLLLLADIVLRKRVRAVFRYWIWMLVLVKLLLPTSLAGPFSIGYWIGDELAFVDTEQYNYDTQAEQLSLRPYPDLSSVGPAVYAPATAGAAIDDPVGESAVVPVAEIQISWQGIVFVLWVAAAGAMVLLLIQRAIFVRGLVAQAIEAEQPIYDILDNCRKRIRVGGRLRLKISPNATSPAVCGLFRPVILLPGNLSSDLGAEDLQVVLLHELAHIKRGDLWVNLLQALVQIAYFYNPLVWLANAVIRRAREQAVDEAVLVTMGERALRYPETLVSVAKLAFKRPALSLRLIGVVESKGALAARVKRILSRPIPKSAKLGMVGFGAIIVAAFVLLPMAKAQPLTDRAEDVLARAETEARRLNHEYIGTEHILLALAEQDDGIGGKVLSRLGVRKESLDAELTKLVERGSKPVTKRKLPRTSRVRKAIEYAEQQAGAFDHDYIGTEHILLGLIQERDGVAARMLAALGVSEDTVRAEVFDLVEVAAAEPLARAYEKAPGSRDLKITVGPTTFKVHTVVRWDEKGNPIFEDGMGGEIRELGFETPDYSKQSLWMDIANIYISPDSQRYDVLELRVFDHQTRRLLDTEGRLGVGYDIRDSVVQLRSIGGFLPRSVDIWLRVLHRPAGEAVTTMPAKAGLSAQLDGGHVSLRMIRPGRWSFSTRQAGGGRPVEIEWTSQEKGEEFCTAVFDFSQDGSNDRYQICAVGVDGRRYVPDFPHFIGPANGRTEIIEFDVAADKVRRFEIRRFGGRDKFYFDNVKLPRIDRRQFEAPPAIIVRLDEDGTETDSNALSPILAKVSVQPGRRVTGTSSYRNHAAVEPASEPYQDIESTTTVTYDLRGVGLGRCFVKLFDSGGNDLAPRGSVQSGSAGAGGCQSAGYETVSVAYGQIDHVMLSLVPNMPVASETAGTRGRRYFATVVVGGDGVTYDGKKMKWAELEEALKPLEKRAATVLEVAVDPALVPKNLSGRAAQEWVASNVDRSAAGKIAGRLGFEACSDVGIDREDSRRGPVSVHFENKLQFDEELTVGLKSFEQRPLFTAKAVRFERTGADISAALDFEMIMYPERKWEVGIRLLDEEGKQVDSQVRTFESNGIVEGVPLVIRHEMKYSFDRTSNLAKARRFEVSLREFSTELAKGKP
ncbi:MAG: hypothetical protein JW720_09980 [Sedimentisphaerales bacterium]|nr:hypothetical protein [Sedimentisphaerales bacterium]